MRVDPDDLEAQLVHADELQARGDPRGELITVQAALLYDEDNAELIRREAEILDAHEEKLFGPWRSRIEVRWRLGYWFSLRFPTADESSTDVAHAATELLSHPSAARLAELAIHFHKGFEAAARALQASLTAPLRRLYVAEIGVGLLLSFPDDFDWSVVGGLTHLELEAHRVRIVKGISLPQLERLHIKGSVPRTQEALLHTEWPSLKSLSLGLPGPNMVWEPSTFPALRALSLRAWSVGQTFAPLAEHRMLEQLEMLSYAQTTLSPRDVELVRAHANALRQVGEIVFTTRRPQNVSPNQVLMSDQDFLEIEKCLPNLRWAT